MNKIAFLFLLVCFSSVALSQKGKISGKITNSKNEALSSVTIKLNGGEKGTTRTNVDGIYVIPVEINKKYTLTLSYVGYKTKTIDNVVVTKAGAEEIINFILEDDSKTLDNVVVKSSIKAGPKGETINALIAFQKNTNTVAQVISGEAIRRSPDKNTGEALKRVPGASTLEGKYLVVRGLADRYNQAMVNGILLSSTEPDRKTFSFDIFPAATIDNIVINKAFVPELPGEWAGGLVQVNTKDIPTSNYLTLQIGTGFNTQTINDKFYTYQGGNMDWLGIDDGTRGLPAGFPNKSTFNDPNKTSNADKIALAKQFKNIWSTQANSSNFLPVSNKAFQLSGGFNKNIGQHNKLGVVLALNYNQSFRRIDFGNSIYSITNNIASVNFDYYNQKYSQDILCGGLANATLQLGNNHKISFKNILNINASDYTTKRVGKDFETNQTIGDNIKATELAFKSNTFYNTQLSGDHNLPTLKSKFHWYGSFTILDQYIPDQRRIGYMQDDPTDVNSPYSLLVSASKTSQKSGSRYFGFLNDYIYTAGADLTKTIKTGKYNQTVKVGYFFQVKDRLFDSRPFAIYIPSGDNTALKHLSENEVFNPENFGNGYDNKFAFNEIYDIRYRYIANSIHNAAFLQFDNNITNKLRATWGMRWENFDQVVGSMNQKDTRHVHNTVDDFLPGANITYKINNLTNLRISGSQTVIRPEFRELSTFSFYDFDLGATVTGLPALQRTKVTNTDIRYEMYPKAGELFTIGAFYKYFQKPIELFFNQTGAGSSNTFNYINAEKAASLGLELEFRKKLESIAALKNFTLQGNFSYIYNRVKSEGNNLDRPMQGQSPYLINLGIMYDVEKSGLNTTLLFNQIGRRIYYVGGSSANGVPNSDTYPPVWEAPRPILDFQIAKKVMKTKGELKLNISDILNQTANYYHDLNNTGKYDAGDALAIKRKYGTGISLSFAYKLK